MRGLDAYITGANIHYDENVAHKCPSCGRIWEVHMFYEWGGWFYVNDDDAYCAKCGTEGSVA